MSRSFLRKILIRDERSAIEALEEIKIQGGDLGSIKSEVERVLGTKIYDVDTALSALNEKINKKVETVESKIDSISKKITSDPERQKIVKETMENVVQQRELLTESETVNSISKAAAEMDIEKATTDELAAKEALVELENAEKENPEAFRQYRITKYVDTSLKEVRKENKNLTPEQEQVVKDQLNEIAGVMYSDGNIGNQRMKVSATFNTQSRGRLKNEIGNLNGMLGFMTSHKKPSDIIKDSDKREEKLKLGRIKIPTNYEKDAFDRSRFLLKKNTRLLRRVSSIQEGGSFLVRVKMTFYNFASGWRRGGKLIETSGGYLQSIGSESASDFALGATGLFLQNGFDTGLGNVVKGVLGSGVKKLAGDAALKLVGGALGPAGLAATKVLSGLKKFFGDAGSKLGIGARNGIGNAVDKGGSFLGKVAMGLGTLLGSVGLIGTAFASTITSGAVIGAVTVPIIYNEYSSSAQISALVTAKKKCASTMEYVDTGKKPPIPCSDMSQYTEDMRTQILDVGYQTRCAVVTAAQYMIFDFPYHVPYKLGGYGEGDMGIDDDWCNGAMDCAGFIRWCYRQGGFAISKQTSTAYWEGGAASTTSFEKVAAGTYFKTNTLKFVPSNCSQIRERVEPGDIVRHGNFAEDGIMHAAIIIGVDGTKLQIAQEGGSGGTGINTCFIDICTGKGTGENPCGTFDRVSLMDTFFDYYSSGNKKIDGFAMRPFSKYILEFTEMDKKKK